MILTAELVYILATLTSLLCTVLLARSYRRSGQRLLLWSSLCFAFLCLNNVLVFIDLIVVGKAADLSTLRVLAAFVGVAMLCYGLIEEEV